MKLRFFLGGISGLKFFAKYRIISNIHKSFGVKMKKIGIFLPKYLRMSKKSSTFACETQNRSRKEVFMTATTNQYERMTVHVPHAEAKRFKAILKAIGFELEK